MVFWNLQCILFSMSDKESSQLIIRSVSLNRTLMFWITQLRLNFFLDRLDEEIISRFLSGKDQTPKKFVLLELYGNAVKGNPL